MLKENLVLLRNMYGYSQEKISEKIEISRQAYAKWETGESVPDIIKCQKLAKNYNVTIDNLLGENDLEGFGHIPPAPVGKNIWGVVTINERGQIIKANLVKAVDTTAAGDCFNGYFASGIDAKLPIEKAIKLGNMAAGISVTRLGAIPSIPRVSEL